MDLRTEWLGRIGYQAAWDRQHQLVADRAAGRIPDTLLLLEHEAVLTLGRHADPSHILAPPDLLAARDGAIAHYPMGIDLLLLDRAGRLLGLPRTTTITGKGA